MEVGLGPGDIVLDGDPAHPRKGAQQPPLFGLCLLWPNCWMDQDATWYGGRRRPRRHCLMENLLPTERGTIAPPTFWPTLLWHGRPSQQLLSSCFSYVMLCDHIILYHVVYHTASHRVIFSYRIIYYIIIYHHINDIIQYVMCDTTCWDIQPACDKRTI